jgi:hypothetical protein
MPLSALALVTGAALIRIHPEALVQVGSRPRGA